MKDIREELNGPNLLPSHKKPESDVETQSSEKQAPSKGFVQNIGDAFSGLFSKESPKHFQKILEDPAAPSYQKNLAIQGIVLKKIKTLNLILLRLIKGDFGATLDVKISAANALAKAGGFYSLELPSVLIVDVVEIYMTTPDLKLYEALHKMFLSEETFPYYKYIVRTLASRFIIAGDVNSFVWEVFSRGLHICFDFKYKGAKAVLGEELKNLKGSQDKQRLKLEQAIHLIKALIKLADEARDKLCQGLATQKDMAQTIEVMYYPSLTASYHEKCRFPKMLEPIMSALLDDKREVRDFVMQELAEIRTPAAYDFYRSVILNHIQPYPDISHNLIVLMANLALIDSSALDIFVSFITTPPAVNGELYFDQLCKICSHEKNIHDKIIQTAKEYIRKNDCPEFSVHQLLEKIFPISTSRDTMDFIVNIVLGKFKVAMSTGSKAAALLVSMNDGKSNFASDIFKTIKLVMTHSAPQELKEAMFKAIKKNPTVQNIDCLSMAVFDIDKTAACLAMKTYLDIAKSGNIEDKVLSNFYLDLCNSETAAPESIVLALEFLKDVLQIDNRVKNAISKLLYHESPEVRKNAFELSCLFLTLYEDEDELSSSLSVFIAIISNPMYPWLDIYKRVSSLLAEFLSSGESEKSRYVENIFAKVKTTLSSSIPSENKIVLCDLLEYVAENASHKLVLQAEWNMELIIKSPNMSHEVTLYVLKTLLLKRNRLIACTPSIIKMISEPSPSSFRTGILEILVQGMLAFPKYTQEEKISAYTQKSPKEIYDYVQWEISINKELLPVLMTILNKEFSDARLVSITLSVIRFLIFARRSASVLINFKDYPNDETIQVRAIEAISGLLFPEFSLSEQNILKSLSKMAADKDLPLAVRSNSAKALGKICDMEQLESLTTLLADPCEKLEIRTECVKAINAFKTPFANRIYADILSDSKTPLPLVEVMLSGMASFADSRVLEPVIAIMRTPSSPKLKELCINLLELAGYGDAAIIENMRLETESIQSAIEKLNTDALAAEKKLELYPQQLNVLNNNRDEFARKLASLEDAINFEKKEIEASRKKFESVQIDINSKIKEFIPNWPSDKRPPPDKKELFMGYQESLREEKDSFEIFAEQAKNRISDNVKEKTKAEELLAEIDAHIEYLNKSKLEQEEVINKLTEESPVLERKREKIFEEIKYRQRVFESAIPSIDEENHSRLIKELDVREEEWRKRRAYYSIIEKNI